MQHIERRKCHFRNAAWHAIIGYRKFRNMTVDTTMQRNLDALQAAALQHNRSDPGRCRLHCGQIGSSDTCLIAQ
jgi:hypothetical protein